MRRGLSACERLSTKREFDRVFREGRTFRYGEIVVKAAPNGLPFKRLGLSVGRRHGNAVRRNRMKRLIREAFRLNKACLSVSCDLVVIPRAGWRSLRLDAIEPVFKKALDDIERAFTGS